MVDQGTVIFSLDAELIWGSHNHENIFSERVEHARESWLFLLDKFDYYDIPATWAIVGHLFLNSCDGTHADHPAGQEWFTRDPGGEFSVDSNWFGRDLIHAVQKSNIEHEIGSHSFSHIEFGDNDTTEEIARAELNHSVTAAKSIDIDLESFIFPRNSIGHRELLTDFDFSCYRGRSPDRWYDNVSMSKLGKLATFTINKPSPPIVKPKIDEFGLVNIPASMYLFTFEGLPRRVIQSVADDPVIRQVHIGLEKLKAKEQGILHLWLHPNNITNNNDRSRMEEIICLVSTYRNQYDIRVETMGQIADQNL